VDLIGTFKTKAFLKDKSVPLLFKDAMLAPQLMKRRKLRLRGDRVRDRNVVQRIFEKCDGAGIRG
jgi:hypothetical protein